MKLGKSFDLSGVAFVSGGKWRESAGEKKKIRGNRYDEISCWSICRSVLDLKKKYVK